MSLLVRIFQILVAFTLLSTTSRLLLIQGHEQNHDSNDSWNLYRVFKMKITNEALQESLEIIDKSCEDSSCAHFPTLFHSSEYLNLCYLILSNDIQFKNKSNEEMSESQIRLLSCNYTPDSTRIIMPKKIYFNPSKDRVAKIRESELILLAKYILTTSKENLVENVMIKYHEVIEYEEYIRNITLTSSICKEKKSLGFVKNPITGRTHSFYVTWDYCQVMQNGKLLVEEGRLTNIQLLITLKAFPNDQSYHSKRGSSAKMKNWVEIETWLRKDGICHNNNDIHEYSVPAGLVSEASQLITISLKDQILHDYIDKIFKISDHDPKFPAFNHKTWLKFLYFGTKACLYKVYEQIIGRSGPEALYEEDSNRGLFGKLNFWIENIEDYFLYQQSDKARFEDNGYLIYLSTVLRGLEQHYALVINNTSPNLYLHVKSIKLLEYEIAKKEKYLQRCSKKTLTSESQAYLNHLLKWNQNLTKSFCHDHGLSIVPCFTSSLNQYNSLINNDIDLPNESDSILLAPSNALSIQIHYRPDLTKYSFQRYLHIKADAYHCDQGPERSCVLIKENIYLRRTVIKVTSDESLFIKVLRHFEGPIRIQFRIWSFLFTATILGLIMAVVLSYIDSETMISHRLNQFYNQCVAYRHKHYNIVKQTKTNYSGRLEVKPFEYFNLKQCSVDVDKRLDSMKKASEAAAKEIADKPSMNAQDITKRRKKRKGKNKSKDKSTARNVELESDHTKPMGQSNAFIDEESDEKDSNKTDEDGIPDWVDLTVDPNLITLETLSKQTEEEIGLDVSQSQYDKHVKDLNPPDSIEDSYKLNSYESIPEDPSIRSVNNRIIEAKTASTKTLNTVSVNKKPVLQLFELIKTTSEGFLNDPNLENKPDLCEVIHTLTEATDKLSEMFNVKRRSSLRAKDKSRHNKLTSQFDHLITSQRKDSRPINSKGLINEWFGVRSGSREKNFDKAWTPASSSIWGNNVEYPDNWPIFEPRDSQNQTSNDEKWSFIKTFTSQNTSILDHFDHDNWYKESANVYESPQNEFDTLQFHLPTDLFDSTMSHKDL